MENTPIKNQYNSRIENLDKSEKFTDLSKLAIGDFIAIPQSPKTSGLTGFVKKIGSKNILIETTYGGWADSDSQLMEIKAVKSDVEAFYKPKNVDDNKLYEYTVYSFSKVNIEKRYSKVTFYEIDKLDDVRLYMEKDTIIKFNGSFYKYIEPKSHTSSIKKESKILIKDRSKIIAEIPYMSSLPEELTEIKNIKDLSFKFPDYHPPVNIQTWMPPAVFLDEYPMVNEHVFHSENGWRIPASKVFSDGKIEVKVKENRKEIEVSVGRLHKEGYRDMSNIPVSWSHLDLKTFENEESLNAYLLTIRGKFSYVYKTIDQLVENLDKSRLEQLPESYSDCLKRNNINLEKDNHRFEPGTIITDNLANIKLKVDSFNDTSVLFDRVYAFGGAVKQEAMPPIAYSELIETFKTGGISVDGFESGEVREFARVLHTIQHCIKMDKLYKENEAWKKSLPDGAVIGIEVLPMNGFRSIKEQYGTTIFEGFIEDRYFKIQNDSNDWTVLDGTVEADEFKLWLDSKSLHTNDKVYNKWIDSLDSDASMPVSKLSNGDPIYLKEVIIKWQEGSNTVTNKSYTNIKEVEHQMSRTGSLQGKDVYYDKNKLIFIWEDGHTEEDRVDVGLSKGDFNPENESLTSYLKESLDEFSSRLNKNYVLEFKEINKKNEITYHKEKDQHDKYMYGATVEFGDKSVFIPLGSFDETEIKTRAEKVLSELKAGTYKDGLSFEEMAGLKNIKAITRYASENSKEAIKDAISGLKTLLSLETDKKKKSEIKEAINGLKILLTL